MKTNLKAIYDHPGMQVLYEEIKRQDHRTLILWALETGQEILNIFTSTFPEDPRPMLALDAAEDWSFGRIKMPAAKKAAKETHEAAKAANENPDVAASQKAAACAAAHAMGQIIGVVHVGTHSPAYAAYAVQAVVLNSIDKEPGNDAEKEPDKDQEEVLAEMVDSLSDRLIYWSTADKDNRPWATFL